MVLLVLIAQFILIIQASLVTALRFMIYFAGYNIEKTAPNTFNEIGAVECLYHTIINTICTMLHTASLPLKFWPYTLIYYINISNHIPHGHYKLFYGTHYL